MKQGRAETQPPLRISGFCHPLKSGAKIVVFEREASQPFRTFPAARLGSLLFCQHQAVGGMGAPCRGLFPACLQFFQSVLANRLEHPEPRFSIRLFDLLHQAFVHHGRHTIEQVQIEVTFGVAHGFHAFQIASREHR